VKTRERDEARRFDGQGDPSRRSHACSEFRDRPSALYGSIQELTGFDRPEWLDLPY
jgi:hypothetical protein